MKTLQEIHVELCQFNYQDPKWEPFLLLYMRDVPRVGDYVQANGEAMEKHTKENPLGILVHEDLGLYEVLKVIWEGRTESDPGHPQPVQLYVRKVDEFYDNQKGPEELKT